MSFLERLSSFDPGLLSQASATWSWWIALPILIVGLGLAGFGARGPLRRATMAFAAGTVGWILCARMPDWIPGTSTPWGAAVVLGIAGLVVPRFGAALAGGLAGIALGRVLFPQGAMAAAASAATFAIVAAIATRRIAAVVSATTGATMTTIAAIALLPADLRATLAPFPAAPLLPLVVIACAGAAFQIGGGSRERRAPEKRRPDPYEEGEGARQAA
ncbi:MAG TPA: hypothetical protein VGD74_04540 [Vulgatibacter sp.]